MPHKFKRYSNENPGLVWKNVMEHNFGVWVEQLFIMEE